MLGGDLEIKRATDKANVQQQMLCYIFHSWIFVNEEDKRVTRTLIKPLFLIERDRPLLDPIADGDRKRNRK